MIKSIGLRGHDIGNNFEQMLKNAVENNVSTLQFALAKTVNDVNFAEVGYSKELSDKIKAELKKNNLAVSVLGCYINPVERDAEGIEGSLRLFENFISYAKDFGATVIGTETGNLENIESTRSEENYQYFLKNLRRLVKKAEEEDVIIGIEPVAIYTVYSPEVMKRVLDDVNSKNLAVIFDLSNIITAANYENQRSIIDTAFDLFGEKIKVIHLKDFAVKDGEKRFAPAGTGLYDIEYLFSKLKKMTVVPDIILDETPLAEYKGSLERLEKLIG